MKFKIIKVIFISAISLVFYLSAYADPIDLTNFSSDPVYDASNGGIVVSIPGEISFYEYADDFGYASDVTFSNDYFLVENDMTVLSFSYDFTLGTDDYDDFFSFSFIEDYNDPNSSEIGLLEADVNNSSGDIYFDLSPYRGLEVSLSWRLLWGWDGYWDSDNNWIADIAGSSARIFNLDIDRDASPIPEPSTIILLGLGLIGIIGTIRKRNFPKHLVSSRN